MKPFAIVALAITAGSAFALGGNPNVRFTKRSGAFPLIENGVQATLLAAPGALPGVLRAMTDLQSDLTKVSGTPPKLSLKGPKIIVGTLGHCEFLDDLAASGKLDVAAIRGKWEASVTQIVDIPQQGRCLVVAGSDKRGTIYALYDLSEAIGVSPWYWWEDVPIKHHANAYVSGRYLSKSPSVKYRGIFLNDEAPSLSNWVYANYGEYKHTFYERVFELLLRLHANYLWPAMWNNCFSVDDPLNPKLADEYGIVMGTSHVEPMMRADKEWNRLHYTDRQWNYDTNPALLEQFWREGVERNKPYENIITIAMRGKVDTPMSESANISLLEKIVAAQRRILAETVNPDVTKVPQLWCLYKEVQEYYEKGMRVPDDVTLLWADDNWGDIRRLPTPDERKRSGGAGVYYHFDYVGGPRNYKWIDTNPIPKVWEQMNLAYRYGADRIWIVNVGDLKPKAFSTEFFLTLARDPNAIGKEDLSEYTRRWAEREFGPAQASAIGRIVSETARLNGRRKPELVGPETYSLLNYREADRVASEFHHLLRDADAIAKQLPTTYQPAFYELVTHSIKAPMVLNDLYTAAARNALYAKQGRLAANAEADLTRSLFAEDGKVTEEYHTINGGKWNHFMDQTHIGYTSWQQPDRNIMPRLVETDASKGQRLGMTLEGSPDVWPGAPTAPKLAFTRFGQRDRKIEFFYTSGWNMLTNVSADAPWILLDGAPRLGGLPYSLRSEVSVAIDWAKAPSGHAVGKIFVGGGFSQTIEVSAWNPPFHDGAANGTYLEGDGVVAIEAEHTSRRVVGNGVEWGTIPGYGRTLSAVEPFPVDFKPFDPGQGAHAEYVVETFTGGDVTLDAVVSPTLAFQPSHGVRVAFGFDNDKPQVIDSAPAYLSRDWERSVSDSVRHLLTKHHLQPGVHTLKMWAVDPGVVVQRLVLDLGGLKPSYLGPPESARVGDRGL